MNFLHVILILVGVFIFIGVFISPIKTTSAPTSAPTGDEPVNEYIKKLMSLKIVENFNTSNGEYLLSELSKRYSENDLYDFPSWENKTTDKYKLIQLSYKLTMPARLNILNQMISLMCPNKSLLNFLNGYPAVREPEKNYSIYSILDSIQGYFFYSNVDEKIKQDLLQKSFINDRFSMFTGLFKKSNFNSNTNTLEIYWDEIKPTEEDFMTQNIRDTLFPNGVFRIKTGNDLYNLLKMFFLPKDIVAKDDFCAKLN